MLGEWSATVCAEANAQLVAASPGVTLGADVPAELARCVEARLRYLIQQGRKRTWGRRGDELSVDDLNAALEASGDERCIGHPRRDNVVVDGAVAVAALDPVEVSVRDVAGRRSRGPPPLEPTLALRWVAVDGEGCAAPPALQGKKNHPEETNDAVTRAVLEGVASGGLDREHELYFRKVIEAIRAEDATDEAAPAVDHQPPPHQGDVYRSLRLDSGLRRVVPYVVRFVVDEAANAKKRPIATLAHAVAAMRALAANDRAHVDLHLHQLLPAALTCVVAKKIGRDDPPSLGGNARHWALRRQAATCVAEVCHRFGDRYANLQPRVCKTFVEALDDNDTSTANNKAKNGLVHPRGLQTRYGAIVGLTQLGPLVVRSLLIPKIADWSVVFFSSHHKGAAALNATIKSSPKQADDARRCLGALMDATIMYFRSDLQPRRSSPLASLGFGATPRTASRRFSPSDDDATASASASTSASASASSRPPDAKRRKKKPNGSSSTTNTTNGEKGEPPARKKRRDEHRVPSELLDVFGEALVPFTAGAPTDLVL